MLIDQRTRRRRSELEVARDHGRVRTLGVDYQAFPQAQESSGGALGRELDEFIHHTQVNTREPS